ncbi:MAG: hypothetical protein A2504_11360 [Bdellovibrionales bacterium RIFOXYD12_FULL_39_22]|nr:MAG: hypothetical protein A2385_09925 [Bdellovibrionales bacterium RIFOXYB1_FULL_39_21]OFZ44269.1 MAG: hypothetical protein A2485_07545 [Bdellovibrionales bacterium RIFOXYC12_FULL_39_17]OFZ46811.1 MAG: hypothetical protein A2404_04780 [Bdellovibrionales bacterium RIFOXYC1_FULL_39_130]OFZ71003.1 MAG: hypothetical protein A2451_00280 [Bdellovibrionales bacterium RIFOXYC2_FULL_39_8]OFZ75912.1 MAG: hypothetical protein A2560_02370 [Bdellovibrionales bacterium RIFOXYD1_FULL_39_84]OFZ95490.1 MAG:
MEQNVIFEKVRQALISSCRLSSADIIPEKTLIEDLNIDSIDLIDLLYTLEKDFNISMKISEFETYAKSAIGDKPFAINNIVTPEGLESLRKTMPEIPADKITPGLSVAKIPYLLSVQSLCNIVEKKLQN